MDSSPVLPTKGRTLRGALKPNKQVPLLWRPAIATLLATVLAGWLTWLAGYRPPEAARYIWGHFDIGKHLGFEYQLYVVAKVLPAVFVAFFVIMAAVLVPRKQSLPSALMASVAMLATLFLAWGAVKSPWAVGAVMAVVIALGPLTKRHGGVGAGLSPLVAVAFFFFAVMGVAKGLDPEGVLVQAGIGAGAGLVVLLVITILRLTTGFTLIKRPEARPKSTTTPPPFFSGGIAMRQALLLGVLLGTTAGLWAATRNHNFFWVMVTFWAITQATPDATFDRGVKRVVGVMIGCLLIGGLSTVATPDVVVTVGFIMLYAGILWWARNYTIYIAGITMMTVALHGDLEHYSFLHWAFLRISDTLIGLVIGFGAYWLVITLPEIRKARRLAGGEQGSP
ncbi:MAG: FUSC family protein [Actinomycetota bacterium]